MNSLKYIISKKIFAQNECYFPLRNLQSFNYKPDPRAIKVDYIGPPDEKSNLRPFVRCIPPNETTLEKLLRLKFLEVETWNQKFWTNHNERFYKEKQEFLRLYQKDNSRTVTSDEISVFYKDFLDRNKRIHILYNTSWYIKNFQLLLLQFKVCIERLLRVIKRWFTRH